MQINGKVLKIIRNCLGISGKEMASRCSISEVYYNELERNIKTSPSEITIRKISDGCGIGYNSLVTLLAMNDTESIRKYLIDSLNKVQNI